MRKTATLFAFMVTISYASAQTLPPTPPNADPAKLQAQIEQLQAQVQQLQNQLEQTQSQAQIEVGQCMTKVGQQGLQISQLKTQAAKPAEPKLPVEAPLPPPRPTTAKP